MAETDPNAGVEEEPVALEEPAGGEEESDDQGPDLWAQVYGDQYDHLREKYGGDPAKLAAAYEELNPKATQMAQELAEFRRYAEEREEWDRQYEQGGAAQAGPMPVPGFDIEAIIRQGGSLFDEHGEIDPAKLAGILSVQGAVQTQIIAQAVQEALEQRFGAFEKEKVAPLASKIAREAQAAEIATLEDTYGTRFDEVTKQAHKIKDDFPDLSTTALYGMAAAQLDQRDAHRRRLEAEGYTLDSKGRPAAPKPRLTSEELELQAQEQIGMGKRSLI